MSRFYSFIGNTLSAKNFGPLSAGSKKKFLRSKIQTSEFLKNYFHTKTISIYIIEIIKDMIIFYEHFLMKSGSCSPCFSYEIKEFR